MSRSVPAVAVLLAISGASALIWEVLWVRLLGAAFGSTAHGAALVTGLTLAGIGVGGWLAGRWADRVGAGLRAYAGAEVGVALLGLLLAVLLPWLAVQPALGGYVLGHDGLWHPSLGSWLSRIGLGALLIGPPALLLGATVPLVLRATLGHPDEVGEVVGWLYGANLLGAAVGALATDAVLVPALGLWGAQWVAAAGNGVAAVGAVALARPSPTPRAWPASEPALRVGAMLVGTGAAAMGLELVWIRFLGSALGPYRASVSIVLGLVLLGMQLGSVGAGLLSRRTGRPAAVVAVGQAVLCVGVVAGLALYDPERTLRWQLAGGSGWTVALGTAALMVLPGAVAMGLVFPLANVLAQQGGRTGSVAGSLVLATAVGNGLGSVGTGFVLLPWLGLRATLVVLLVLAALAPIALWRPRRHGAFFAGIGVAVGAALVPLTWSSDRLLLAGMPANRVALDDVLAVREGLEHTLVVTGDPEGPARLWTGGHPMTSTTEHAQRYMRLLSHLPLLLQDDPKRALVICFGVGNTLHAASLHPLDELVAVDLSADVVALAPHFAHANHGVRDDPRARVVIEDGRRYLRAPGGQFDLIALEPPPLAHAGTNALYARELYSAAAARLTRRGLVAQWLPAYQLPAEDVAAVISAFVDVFPEASLHLGSGRELLLIGGRGRHSYRLGKLRRRLEARPEVRRDLARFGIGPRELAASTLAGPEQLLGVAAGVDAVTDDRPRLEYARSSHVMATSLPAGLLAEVGAHGCLDCGSDPEVQLLVDQVRQLVTAAGYQAFDNRRGDSTVWLATEPVPGVGAWLEAQLP